MKEGHLPVINCTKCRAPIQGAVLSRQAPVHCSSCGTLLHVNIFPALFRNAPSGGTGESLATDDEATCFYHPKKKAVISCSACGRFLCSLCDVEFKDRHLCTSCLETGKKKNRIKDLENHRTLYDSIALTLAIAPMLFLWPSILAAPVVLFLVIRYWKSPTSLVRRTKARMIAALVLGILEIIGWSFALYIGVSS